MGFVNEVITTYEGSSTSTARATMDQNLVTHAINIANATTTYALYAKWTGTPVGTITFLGSEDGVTFNVTLASQATGGGVGSLTFDNFGSGLQAVQVTYTFSSSTGTLLVELNKRV
jgi:hypothetical protein